MSSRPSPEQWRDLKDRNFDRNRDGEEDISDAASVGDVNVADLGKQLEDNKYFPYTFEAWAMDAISDKAELNRLLRELAKRVPENLIPVRLQDWVYAEHPEDPLSTSPFKYARAYVIRGQQVAPDVETLVVYSGLSGKPEKVRIIDEMVRQECTNDFNKALLTYMLEQHKQVKKNLADAIWVQFPSFRLTEVVETLEDATKSSAERKSAGNNETGISPVSPEDYLGRPPDQTMEH